MNQLFAFCFQQQFGFVKENYFFEKLKWVAGAALRVSWGSGNGFGNLAVSDHLSVLCARRCEFLVLRHGAVYCFQLVSG
jgi:hypothetical protein